MKKIKTRGKDKLAKIIRHTCPNAIYYLIWKAMAYNPIIKIKLRKCRVSNNHHEVHEDNEVKNLQALHVLHGKNNFNRSGVKT